MNPPRTMIRIATLLLTSGLVLASFQASPEDIDIFSVDEDSTVNKPNVLFVIDNSANWARQAQQWPGGVDQGQSEVRAIKTVINELQDNSINVGLMEYITGGSSSDTNSGYVRYHIRPMNTTNKATFSTKLDRIFNNINDPAEKRSQGNPFGTLFWDVYNYLAGTSHSNSGTGTPAAFADTAAYTTNYSAFRTPLTSSDTCTRTIVIFIANNTSSGPTGDGSENVAALETLGGADEVAPQISFVNYTVESTPVEETLAHTDACYTSAASCSTAVNNTDCTDEGYDSCSCDAGDTLACPTNHYERVGSRSETRINTVSGPTTVVTPNAYTGEVTYCQNNSPGAYTCPAASTTNTTSGNQTTTTVTSWSGCSYVETPASCGSNNNKSTWTPRGTRTVTTTVREANTVTVRSDDPGQTPLGETAACYTGASSCEPSDFPAACTNGTWATCFCDAPGSNSGCAASGSQRFRIKGQYQILEATQGTTFTTPPTQGGNNFMADEWARFLRNTGVPITDTEVKSPVTTYTVDVFNAQQDATQSALLFNMARVGGGKYFQAKNEDSLLRALRQIFTEVQAVNSAFSSASLPVNATNRAQNENQVFIGLFRPDREKKPLWFGNMKRFQLIQAGAAIDLGDKNGDAAINNLTGFISDCAESFWSTDSGNFWEEWGVEDPNAEGICGTNSTSDFSDLPDGPFVEKGAVSEVLRKGNTGTSSASAGDQNFTLNRTVKTLSAGALADFTTATSGLSTAVVDFARGQDVNDEDTDSNVTEPRSTIHGDVVHSRPQPVNFSETDNSRGVEVYYGANDGTFRAVKADTGQELWAFIAPEHYGKLQRLREWSDTFDTIRYFADAVGSPKDYFFDGSIGVYQTEGNTDVWIFPTMRRGGRKIYAFDVTAAGAPIYLWSKGCPNLTDDTNCDNDAEGDFTGIGQTWSLPNVAKVNVDGTDLPVVIMGGGHDPCEDENAIPTGCDSTTKGRGVYVINAETGELVRHFDFSDATDFPGSRSIAADVALIDTNFDGVVDYAYAADMGGSVYRMNFHVSADPDVWDADRIARTDGDGRKFMFTPALLQATTSVIYLAIGSGDREHPLRSHYAYDLDLDSDLLENDAVLNRFYVFKDYLGDASPSVLDLDDDTAMRDFSGVADPGCAANGGPADPVLPGDDERGWFIDLDEQGKGEQVVTSAVIAAGFVVFSTNRPTATSATSCTTSLGEARGYFMNVLNSSGGVGVDGLCDGDRSGVFVGGGLAPSPVMATVPVGENGDIKTVLIGAVQRGGGVSSTIQSQHVQPPVSSRRTPVYWFKSTGD